MVENKYLVTHKLARFTTLTDL